MNLIPIYTAVATAEGGRSGGRVSTADGLLDFKLDLPEELGGENKDAINPEQLVACALAASVADAICFVVKKRNRILRTISVTAKITFGQYDGDGLGIGVEFQLDLPKLSKSEEVEIVAEVKDVRPYTKAIRGAEDLKIAWNQRKPKLL